MAWFAHLCVVNILTLMYACFLVHAALDPPPPRHPVHANCLSATELVALSETQLSAEEKTLLKLICIRKESLPVLNRPANATAFHGPVTHDGIPDNVTCTETLWSVLVMEPVFMGKGL